MASTPDTDPVLPVFLQVLRERGTLTFILADLGTRAGIVALDKNVIVLNETNTDGAHRATICHELLHLHCGECPEHEIERMTAELLVPLPDALAAANTGDITRLADRLGVDPQLVRNRIRALTADAEHRDGVG